MHFAEDEFLLLSRSGRSSPGLVRRARERVVPPGPRPYGPRWARQLQISTPRASSQERAASGGSPDHSERAARRSSVSSSASSSSLR